MLEQSHQPLQGLSRSAPGTAVPGCAGPSIPLAPQKMGGSRAGGAQPASPSHACGGEVRLAEPWGS